MDRTGRQVGSIDPPGFLVDFRLSPDEKRAAMDLVDAEVGGRQIWVQEFARGVATRFAFGALQDVTPVWSPDGSRIAFASDRGGPTGLHQIYQKSSSGAGDDEPLLRESAPKFITDWSRDGRFILYEARAPESSTRADLWVLGLQGERSPRPFLRTAFNESHGRFSPDGKWIAYVSDETGRPEVYVQSFPVSSGKWKISNEGGHQPIWRRDGKELFFFSRNRHLHAVTVASGSSTFEAGPARPLFLLPPLQAHIGRYQYDVSADGQRFLVSTVTERPASLPLHVVLNWTAGLKK
jgi:Tol biopolymer transport system component